MADFADDAAEITENYLQVALQNARQQPQIGRASCRERVSEAV